ncbi:MAG: GTPase ObgE [bacterium]
MFVDRAKIYVKAGDGGNGCLAFRREKFVPKGGPSGGNGGKGGDVVIESTEHLNTLLPFRYKRHFKAPRGGHGSGNNRQGKSADQVVIQVPVGTQVIDESVGVLLFDFVEANQRFVVARGGQGGRGNAAFTSSTNQAPQRWEEGGAGEEISLRLELKVLADVGLVGYPNAGKSTLISVMSSAKPKIADYPFTTISPNLGVVALDNYEALVMADIPGLIEGAHSGIGLGDQFLRHVERCRFLLHLVDVSGLGPDDPALAVTSVNGELGLYDLTLLDKPQLVVASKMDAVEVDKLKRLEGYCSKNDLELFAISAVSGKGIEELKRALARQKRGGIQ